MSSKPNFSIHRHLNLPPAFRIPQSAMKPSSLLPLLFFLAATHLVVDLVAGTLNPLWPRFDEHYHLAPWQTVLVSSLASIASVSQFVFGMYGDRFNARWLLWTGPAIATICLCSVGLFQSPLILGILLAASGLGIAAFHPEGAALAGSCVPEHRSRAMSIFTVGGFIGQAIGPTYSGSMVDWLGLPGLAWGSSAGWWRSHSSSLGTRRDGSAGPALRAADRSAGALPRAEDVAASGAGNWLAADHCRRWRSRPPRLPAQCAECIRCRHGNRPIGVHVQHWSGGPCLGDDIQAPA
jgi:hypothetical protein